MSQSVISETVLFFQTIQFGIWIAILYDGIRIFRRVVLHNVIAVSIEDILYWLFCGYKLCEILYYYNNGSLRLYIIMGTGIGMLAYKLTISDKIVNLVSKILIKIKKVILRIYTNIGRRAGAPVNFLKVRFIAIGIIFKRRLRRITRVMKKKLTDFIKMIKIILCKQ